MAVQNSATIISPLRRASNARPSLMENVVGHTAHSTLLSGVRIDCRARFMNGSRMVGSILRPPPDVCPKGEPQRRHLWDDACRSYHAKEDKLDYIERFFKGNSIGAVCTENSLSLLRSGGALRRAHCYWFGPNKSGRRMLPWCDTAIELDMTTLIWTRGEAFPINQLASRLKCPKCGFMNVPVYLRAQSAKQ